MIAPISTSRALGDIGISLSDLCLVSSVQAAPTSAATASNCFDSQGVLVESVFQPDAGAAG
jgi:hypothetical protein